MAWPPDSGHWLAGGGRTVPTEAMWPDAWRDATLWWLRREREAGEAWEQLGEKLLVELVEGLARRFEGEQVELSLRGRPMGATLDEIALRRRGPRWEVRVELRELGWDGLKIEALSAVVRSVRLEPPPASSLIASGAEIAGRTSIEGVVAWLDGRVPGWKVGTDAHGRVQVRRRLSRLRSSICLHLEPVVYHGVLTLELRAFRLGSLRVPIPSWLRVTREVPLPALGGGVSVAEARRRDHAVDFHLTVSSVSERLEVDQLREAILRGSRVTLP